jgi:alanyl-tRNA synthetase
MAAQEKIDFSFRVIGDHIRTLTFAIGDGILPGNEGRHYVLRRILRRAVAFAKRLNLPGGSFSPLADAVIERMSPVFPELQRNREIILKTISSEEAMFEKTLDRGILLLEDICARAKSGEISGFDAFMLYDTYGFPFDLTQLIAKERGLKIDEEGFQTELERQRERARNAQKKSQITIAGERHHRSTDFVGYENFENIHGEILQIVRDKNATYMVTDKTPFYGEKGGQVGDRGEIIYHGERVSVSDTIYSPQGNILHKIERDVGFVEGEEVILNVDAVRRKEIQRHHTATHILHAALRKILGSHVKQCGSYVGDRGLRFDFNHFSSLSREELKAVEDFVNDIILKNLQIDIREMPFREVPADCIAHFSEKYGEIVRVVSAGDVSMELCGGCHASSSGELGFFKIVKESAIAAGVRRMEAVVGQSAKIYVDRRIAVVSELEQQFSVRDDEVLARIKQLQDSKNAGERRLRTILEKSNQKIFDEICHRTISEDGLKKVKGIFEIDNPHDLRSLSTLAIKREACDVVIFGGNLTEGAAIAVSCSPNAVGKKCDASPIAKQIAEKFNGKGGGSAAFGMVNVARKLEPNDLDDLKF